MVADDDGVVVGVDDGRVVVVGRPWPPAGVEEGAGVEEAGSVEVVVVEGEEDGAVGSGEKTPAGAVVVLVVDGSMDGSVEEDEGSVAEGSVAEGSVAEGSVVEGSGLMVAGSGTGSVAGTVSVVVGSVAAPGSEPVSATA